MKKRSEQLAGGRIYKLRRLEEAELEILRRRGKASCRRPCNAPVAFRVVSLAPRRGRVAGGSRTWLLCEEHTKKFAATHLIQHFRK